MPGVSPDTTTSPFSGRCARIGDYEARSGFFVMFNPLNDAPVVKGTNVNYAISCSKLDEVLTGYGPPGKRLRTQRFLK